MKNRIYYFTGTGNSLDAAKRISEQLDNTELVRITKKMDIEEDISSFERIGFIVPTYMGGVPEMVKEFIPKLKFSNNTYLFTAATCGGTEGVTNKQLRKLIENQGGFVSASFIFNYPANNQTRYAPVSKEQAIRANKLVESDINSAVKVIKEKSVNGYKSKPGMEQLIKASLITYGIKWPARGSDKEFIVEDSCTGCGTCSNVCPAENIKIVNHKPDWQHQCERCTACMQVCPVQAIQFGNVSKAWGRYKNPNVSVQELFVKSNN